MPATGQAYITVLFWVVVALLVVPLLPVRSAVLPQTVGQQKVQVIYLHSNASWVTNAQWVDLTTGHIISSVQTDALDGVALIDGKASLYHNFEVVTGSRFEVKAYTYSFQGPLLYLGSCNFVLPQSAATWPLFAADTLGGRIFFVSADSNDAPNGQVFQMGVWQVDPLTCLVQKLSSIGVPLDWWPPSGGLACTYWDGVVACYNHQPVGASAHQPTIISLDTNGKRSTIFNITMNDQLPSAFWDTTSETYQLVSDGKSLFYLGIGPVRSPAPTVMTAVAIGPDGTPTKLFQATHPTSYFGQFSVSPQGLLVVNTKTPSYMLDLEGKVIWQAGYLLDGDSGGVAVLSS